MGRYLPANKNEKGDVDESHIHMESAIGILPAVLAAPAPVPAANLVKNDRNSYFVSNFAAPQAFIAAHFSFNDSIQNENAAPPSFPVTRKNASMVSTGTVKVMVDSDLFTSEHHYATDFIAQTDKGSEQTNVTIQPVDYSIPMLFPTAQRGVRSAPAAESSSDEANSSSSSVYYTAPNPLRTPVPQMMGALQTSAAIKQEAASLCDWAVPDASVEAWSEMLFDLDVESNTLLDFPLKSEPAVASHHDECYNFNLSMPLNPCWEGKFAPGAALFDVESVGGMGAVERLRSDSFADVLSFCADLF